MRWYIVAATTTARVGESPLLSPSVEGNLKNSREGSRLAEILSRRVEGKAAFKNITFQLSRP